MLFIFIEAFPHTHIGTGSINWVFLRWYFNCLTCISQRPAQRNFRIPQISASSVFKTTFSKFFAFILPGVPCFIKVQKFLGVYRISITALTTISINKCNCVAHLRYNIIFLQIKFKI